MCPIDGCLEVFSSLASPSMNIFPERLRRLEKQVPNHTSILNINQSGIILLSLFFGNINSAAGARDETFPLDV
jgi:hypothetical protein